MSSTTASVGNAKMLYWGGKGRDLEGGREDLNEREVRRIKVDNHNPSEMEAPTNAQVPSLPKFRQPGERLWHESPTLGYSYLECYDGHQAWVKDQGVNVPYRSAPIDFDLENNLLRDDKEWLSFVSLDHKEKEFNSSLLNNIGTEMEKNTEDYIDMVGKSMEFKERAFLPGERDEALVQKAKEIPEGAPGRRIKWSTANR